MSQLLFTSMSSLYPFIGTLAFTEGFTPLMPFIYNAWYIWNQFPKLSPIITQQIERATTLVGQARSGRMPIYVGPPFDQSVFIDFLLNTVESTVHEKKLWQFEIIPLAAVDEFILKKPWHKALSSLVNTAIEKKLMLSISIFLQTESIFYGIKKITISGRNQYCILQIQKKTPQHPYSWLSGCKVRLKKPLKAI